MPSPGIRLGFLQTIDGGELKKGNFQDNQKIVSLDSFLTAKVREKAHMLAQRTLEEFDNLIQMRWKRVQNAEFQWLSQCLDSIADLDFWEKMIAFRLSCQALFRSMPKGLWVHNGYLSNPYQTNFAAAAHLAENKVFALIASSKGGEAKKQVGPIRLSGFHPGWSIVLHDYIGVRNRGSKSALIRSGIPESIIKVIPETLFREFDVLLAAAREKSDDLMQEECTQNICQMLKKAFFGDIDSLASLQSKAAFFIAEKEWENAASTIETIIDHIRFFNPINIRMLSEH